MSTFLPRARYERAVCHPQCVQEYWSAEEFKGTSDPELHPWYDGGVCCISVASTDPRLEGLQRIETQAPVLTAKRKREVHCIHNVISRKMGESGAAREKRLQDDADRKYASYIKVDDPVGWCRNYESYGTCHLGADCPAHRLPRSPELNDIAVAHPPLAPAEAARRAGRLHAALGEGRAGLQLQVDSICAGLMQRFPGDTVQRNSVAHMFDGVLADRAFYEKGLQEATATAQDQGLEIRPGFGPDWVAGLECEVARRWIRALDAREEPKTTCRASPSHADRLRANLGPFVK